MIYFTKGNIINSDSEALVNTVNTVGVMGKGIALAFKKAFPENFKIYKNDCDNNNFKIGDILVTQTGQLTPKYILNFPTKEHWRGRSKIQYIEIGMKKFVNVLEEYEIKSVAIPPLGCGNGGLNWDEVKPIILKAIDHLIDRIDFKIYEPGFNNQGIKVRKTITLTPARAMLVNALKNYQVLGYSINLLVAQKIAYFLQRFGEPLNLTFQKGHYGPYSHQLQHLLKYLNGHFLKFKHEETKPDTSVTLNNYDVVQKYSEENLSEDQIKRLSLVQELIEGFESPYGLELLATVDFIYQNESIGSINELSNRISEWTRRKKKIMKSNHIKVADRRLKEYYHQQILLVKTTHSNPSQDTGSIQ